MSGLESIIKEKRSVSTPLYYSNKPIGIGGVASNLAADVLARWWKIEGYDVRFLTGSDEHGKKVEDTAKELGMTPQELVDEVAQANKEINKFFSIEPDVYVRTTSQKHIDTVNAMTNEIIKNHNMYFGIHKGDYCQGCEKYLGEKDLIKNEEGTFVCKDHLIPPNHVEEKTVFFKLEKYLDKLMDLYEKNPEFVSPHEKFNEIKQKVYSTIVEKHKFDLITKLLKRINPNESFEWQKRYVDAILKTEIKHNNYTPESINYIRSTVENSRELFSHKIVEEFNNFVSNYRSADFSVSRRNTKWGINWSKYDEKEFNFMFKQFFSDGPEPVEYVWLEAPMGYVTGLGGFKTEEFNQWWPIDKQIVGKDINSFHSYFWTALTLAANIEAPKQIFAHNFWFPAKKTEDGIQRKASKSGGTQIDIVGHAEKYSPDVVRFYLSYHFPRKNDSFFSIENLEIENDSLLVNIVGNSYNRVHNLIKKNFNGIVPTEICKLEELKDENTSKFAYNLDNDVEFSKEINNLEYNKAIDRLVNGYRSINKYLEENEPWSLLKDKKAEIYQENRKKAATILTYATEALNNLATKISIFMPESACKMKQLIGSDNYNTTYDINNIKGKKVSEEPFILFKKIKEDKYKNVSR